MNKRTVALTKEMFEEIIITIRTGFTGFRGNDRLATILNLEANLGIRISDILNLSLLDIIKDGNRYRLNIVEQKTQKKREFTVHQSLYNYIQLYCLKNKIEENEKIFNITERAVQKQLKKVVDYLGYENISTHSFRKFFATNIYNNNGKDIVLVQKLLQHSDTKTTRKYIGISDEKVETALEKHILLV